MLLYSFKRAPTLAKPLDRRRSSPHRSAVRVGSSLIVSSLLHSTHTLIYLLPVQDLIFAFLNLL